MAFWHTFVRVSGVQRVEKAWSLHDAIRKELDIVDGECEQRVEDLAEMLEEIIQAKVSGLRTLRKSIQLIDQLKPDPVRLGAEGLESIESSRRLIAAAGSILDAPEDGKAAVPMRIAAWVLVDRTGPAGADTLTKWQLPGSAPASASLLCLMIRSLVTFAPDEDAVEQITVRALLAIEQRRAVIAALKGIDILCRDYHRDISKAWKGIDLLYHTVEASLMPHGVFSRLRRRLRMGMTPEREDEEMQVLMPLIQAGAQLTRIMNVALMDAEGRVLKLA